MCPTLYYFQSGGNCLPCYSTCSTCNGTNSDQCLTCIDGLFLSQGMCRYVCPIKTYPQV
jgi:proprotein convertase subtilisin/kexin type 5